MYNISKNERVTWGETAAVDLLEELQWIADPVLATDIARACGLTVKRVRLDSDTLGQLIIAPKKKVRIQINSTLCSSDADHAVAHLLGHWYALRQQGVLKQRITVLNSALAQDAPQETAFQTFAASLFYPPIH